MKKEPTVPANISALIPPAQLDFIKTNKNDLETVTDLVKNQLKICPDMKETDDDLNTLPVIFHYYYGASEFFICKYDRKDHMFGYGIINGDVKSSEFGFFSLKQLMAIPGLQLNFSNKEKTIEDALKKSYPKDYKKMLAGSI